MRAVLGIDAAWTANHPSGVAAAIEKPDGWHLVAAVSSYERFHALANGAEQTNERPSGSLPNAKELLGSASALCHRPVDLVAIDMPLARSPISGRRVADRRVSEAYGARQCGTHTPSSLRPGRLSDDLKDAFERAGYGLCTSAIATPGIVEVYPHPALVELARAPMRLPYKVSKVDKYWPRASRDARRANLFQQWRVIAAHLECRIAGVAGALSVLEPGARNWELKASEDVLDAIICAWIAICCLEGMAMPYGDTDAAIWIPNAELLLNRPRDSKAVRVIPDVGVFKKAPC